ncbi:glycoside hydrolase [Metschnikowia bicuspidata]|uniref:chitinase n=1 Tax=Metschnikowia bicuspidata TaxID=27322 RepID=A0A4P9Z9Y5_9ASCO|nr:glycoside hydrolase [Metschnikowia bicuspidata]
MLYIVGLYYANWAVYASKHFPADLPPDVTHVFYAFMKPNPSTGELDSTDPWADFQLPIEDATGAVAALMALKYQRPALKVVLAIGGWGSSPEFRAVAKDPAKLRTFVSSTTEKVRRLGFDGVDIDWEYPETAKEADQLVSMLRQLRAALDAVDPKLSLSVAAPAGSDKIAVLDVPAMDQYLSFWNIMCYDFVGSGWSDRTGLHSNLYGHNGANGINGDMAVRLYRDRGASVSKLVLGMPMFGRVFLKPAQPILGSTFAGHLSEDASLMQFQDIDRAEEVYVEKSVGAYLYNNKTELLVTYDNEECLKRKAEYVRQNRLAGGFWWDSRGNRPRYTLVDAFVKVLRL